MSDHANIIRTLRQERDDAQKAATEAESGWLSLRTELARLLGTISARSGVSKNDQLIAKVGGVLIERDEARAEADRLRIRYGSFLDWAIGFVDEGGRFGPSLAWFERLESRLLGERAALAVAQEPPADPCQCGQQTADQCFDRCVKPLNAEPPAERSRTICAERSGVMQCVKPENHDGPHSWEPPAQQYEVSARGFKRMATVTCDYGSTVDVYESSAADRAGIWLAVDQTGSGMGDEPGVAHAHLSIESATVVRDHLSWLVANHWLAQEPPGEIIPGVEITDIGTVIGELPTTRLLARLNLDGLAVAQEPPAPQTAEQLQEAVLEWFRITDRIHDSLDAARDALAELTARAQAWEPPAEGGDR